MSKDDTPPMKVNGGSKSVALLWLRQKNVQLMNIAQSVKPSDTDDEYGMNLFLDLTSLFGAMDSAIDMVEEVQKKVWEAEARNAQHQLTIQQLTRKIKAYEQRLGELNEDLK